MTEENPTCNHADMGGSRDWAEHENFRDFRVVKKVVGHEIVANWNTCTQWNGLPLTNRYTRHANRSLKLAQGKQ